jgi:acetylornithine deacetylase/succinyl-diaminopimelate desuccinylase-like protein
MNAKGGNIHSKNEYVNINSLDTLYKIYQEFLETLENCWNRISFVIQ